MTIERAILLVVGVVVLGSVLVLGRWRYDGGGRGHRRGRRDGTKRAGVVGWRCRSAQNAQTTNSHISCAAQTTAAALGGGGLTTFAAAIRTRTTIRPQNPIAPRRSRARVVRR